MTMIDNRNRFLRCLDALSQVGNVLLLNGNPNESISGRMWREQNLTAVRWINRLFWWQYKHCQGAYRQDRERQREYAALEHI